MPLWVWAECPCAVRAQNQFDSLDLSDNEIRKLECLAVLPRVKMLLLSNNRIIRIAEGLGKAFPKLETLVLSNNAIGAPLPERRPTVNRGETAIATGLEESLAFVCMHACENDRCERLMWQYLCLASGTLRELEGLASLRTLTMLSLVDNPVTKLPNYRALVIARLPKLKVHPLPKPF